MGLRTPIFQNLTLISPAKKFQKNITQILPTKKVTTITYKLEI